jgi:hypothetical protein
VTTSQLSEVAGGYQAIVMVTSTGTGTAQNLELNTATLGTASGMISAALLEILRLESPSQSVLSSGISGSFRNRGGGEVAPERASCIRQISLKRNAVLLCVNEIRSCVEGAVEGCLQWSG